MAANIGNAAEHLPENEITDEPSMEEILSSIKQIIADDEQSDGASGNREDFTHPDTPSNSNQSESRADEEELSVALQAELNDLSFDEEKSSAVPQAPTHETGTVSNKPTRGDLETRVAAVRAEFSSASETLSPEERLQHYRSRNKLKTGTLAETTAPPIAQPARQLQAGAIRTPLPEIQKPVPISPSQAVAPPAPQAVAQEMAAILLKENSSELETMLADLMRPTIRQWLNDNLPSLVQRLVREEIRAASRGQKTS